MAVTSSSTPGALILTCHDLQDPCLLRFSMASYSRDPDPAGYRVNTACCPNTDPRVSHKLYEEEVEVGFSDKRQAQSATLWLYVSINLLCHPGGGAVELIRPLDLASCYVLYKKTRPKLSPKMLPILFAYLHAGCRNNKPTPAGIYKRYVSCIF